MDKVFLALGAGLAGLAVALGAFGAHALRAAIPADLLANFETGVRYHMYHALGLLAVSFAITQWRRSLFPVFAGWLFVAGIGLFSFSLYVMALTGWRWLGAITPLGGAAFIAGWMCLGVLAARCVAGASGAEKDHQK
ncbi:MAG: DUF423 domain-containing protein [Candidatus Roseilinea sp.]|uniref:DUF423 domain-containing protein n=1 Tax=Candidatus Roseilinea sp. TaxID=2838777 RepID=UPI00404AC36F